MATPRKEASIDFCPEGKRLLEAFVDAVEELSLLQDQQIAAMMAGDLDFERFDILIHLATEKKQQAKYAYIDHRDVHGC